jgi:hypothetical protein
MFYNPVTGDTIPVNQWERADDRTNLSYSFSPNESIFVIFEPDNNLVRQNSNTKNWIETETLLVVEGDWKVTFDSLLGGPNKPVTFGSLTDWSVNPDNRIRFYSGTAVYSIEFQLENEIREDEEYWIELGDFANIAEVSLNGKHVGTSWTPPYRLLISDALLKGENRLEIAVTNTWANRIKGDHVLPEEKRITWTTAPYRLDGKPLLPSGLFGPVTVAKSL